MGLDMYLTAERYISEYSDPDLSIKANELMKDGPGPVKGITCEAIYWRKANAIHKWFVRECQGGRDECQRTFIPREKLQELLDTIKQVLGDSNRKAVAESLLPTGSGFFFGSTEYDEWYFRDLEYTEKKLQKILAMPDNWDFYYYASW